MLKNVARLGKSLTKEDQKNVTGGYPGMRCNTNADCWESSPYLGPGDISCRYGYFGTGYKVCVFN